MANSWLKLYHEMLNDPKMGTMTDHLYRRTIELFLLAGQEDRNGLLPPLTQIAWALRTTVNDATLCLQELTELGIVTKTEYGFLVTHFMERQNTNLSDAERSARQREKQKASRGLSDARHADHVTDDTQTDTQTDTELSDAPSRSSRDESSKNVTPDKDKEEDKDKDKEKELINNKLNINNSMDVKQHNAAEKSAAAREKSGKQKLTPSDPGFWKRAFGPEADRAQAFYAVSGIVPIGTEFGRWQKDLRAFTEAGISIDQMTRAVKKVRKDGRYPIKAPGTVLTEARNLAAEPIVVQKSTADYLDDLSWEGCDE